MASEHQHRGYRLPWVATAVSLAMAATASAQLIEDLDGVTGTGGVTVLSGAGNVDADGWDDGIAGEHAFAGTIGNTTLDATAEGTTTGGVGGTGAGRVSIADVLFNLLDQNFNAVTASGGGAFLIGDGTPDTFGFTANWDDGVSGEGAFAGTFDGAALDGSVTAEGTLSGGVAGSGGARLDVDDVTPGAGNWFAGLQFDVSAFPGATPLFNSGFDDDNGSFNNWTTFGNAIPNVIAETNPALGPRSAPAVLKIFGQFNGSANGSGVFQSVPAEAGQTWQLDAYSKHVTGDVVVGGNTMVMRIEFLDAGDAVLAQTEAQILDALSPVDEWIDNTPVTLVAPAGTVTARAVIAFEQPALAAGAGLVDDVSFKIIAGPTPVNVAAFQITADVRGSVNAAGETLGDYQMRLEDSDGNRLIFFGTANGSYQSVGGNLAGATEADADGNLAVGVFNENSPFYRLVVAFDNENVTPWGTGGTLEVDNLLSPSNDPAGNAWFAGAFWPHLTVPAGALNDITLTADIMGDSGGAYELRLECFRIVEAGLDDDFESIDGLGGDQGGVPFLSFDDFDNGATFGFSGNWDDGITGEGAFGGIAGDTQVFDFGPNSGFSARGVTSGGNGGGGAGEIRVEDLGLGNGTWFAGLSWAGQGLASTDLSQVTLSADIKGELTTGVTLGTYELRIEDADGDRMFFPMTANGNWQVVGGPLSTATFGNSLAGPSNGVFDLDSPSYSVAVAFTGESTTWVFGGLLTVDNLFLTAVDVPVEIGRAAFPGVADGSFQAVGGALSSAVTDLGDHDLDFENAALTGGGAIDGGPWDDAFPGDQAFAGTFGAGTLGTTTAAACATCGVGGSQGVQLVWDGASTGYFIGIAIRELSMDLSGCVVDYGAGTVTNCDIQVTAMVRAIVDGAGETLGQYTLRLEDGTEDFLAFDVVPGDQQFQLVGGSLNSAVPGSTPNGNQFFNTDAGTYIATLVVLSDGVLPDWGTGAELVLDDLHLDGVPISAADECSVVVAMTDSATWGTAGTIVFDNINFDASTAGCTGSDPGPCVDLDDNAVIDDVCTWGECVGDACNVVAKSVPADISSAFGGCPPDGFCNIHDRNQALTCFAGTTLCPTINIDAGGAFGACPQDGFCNIHDANAALTCFAGTNTCSCGPQPEIGGGAVVGTADLAVVSAQRTITPQDTVAVRVFLADASALQSYQLHLDVSGGTAGTLELVDIAIEARKDELLGGVAGFEAFNIEKGQMLRGLDTAPDAQRGGGYLATYFYRPTADAAGTFVIDVRHDPAAGDQTFLVSDFVNQVDIRKVQPALVQVRAERPHRR